MTSHRVEYDEIVEGNMVSWSVDGDTKTGRLMVSKQSAVIIGTIMFDRDWESVQLVRETGTGRLVLVNVSDIRDVCQVE